MDVRVWRRLSQFWDWVLPGLAALDPMVAAYYAAYFEEGAPSGLAESAERQNVADVGVVIPGPFQPVKASG